MNKITGWKCFDADLKCRESISHGPCFPLSCTDRFHSHRIEDCHGNVVIDIEHGRDAIWLPEAAEYLVLAGNSLPALLAEVTAARAWLAADSEYTKSHGKSSEECRAAKAAKIEARAAYRKVVEEGAE